MGVRLFVVFCGLLRVDPEAEATRYAFRAWTRYRMILRRLDEFPRVSAGALRQLFESVYLYQFPDEAAEEGLSLPQTLLRFDAGIESQLIEFGCRGQSYMLLSAIPLPPSTFGDLWRPSH